MCRKGENIYKRKDGRWEGRVLIDKGKYLYFYGKSYSEVKEKKRNIMMDSVSITSQVTKSDASVLFQQWLSDCKGRVRQSTYENYHYCMNGYIVPFFQRVSKEVLSAEQIMAFIEHIYGNERLSPSYQKKIISIFKTAIRSIVKEDPDARILLESIKLPKTEASPIEAFSVDEQRRIEQVLTRSIDEKAFGLMLCFYSGLRLGELGALKFKDLDFDTNMLTVSSTLMRVKNFNSTNNRTCLFVGKPKNRSSMRKIPLPDFLCVIGKALKDSYKSTCYILSGSEKPLDPRCYQRYYKTVLKKAKVEYRKLHTVRHTFATRALEMGVDIKTLSDLLGHSNAINTLNIYAHSLMEHKKSAIAKLDMLHSTHMASL